MDYYSERREVEKVKAPTRSERRTELRAQGRIVAGVLRRKSDYLAAVFGHGPLVVDMRAAADLLDAIVTEYTPDEQGRI